VQLGLCPACATPYAAADVVGLGILRPRPAAAGGPTIEYRCGLCSRVIVLVPHGEGRYAPPGAPPPPPVPPEKRRPAWTDGTRRPVEPPQAARPSDTRPPGAAARTEHADGHTAAGERAEPRAAPAETSRKPVGPTEALELLGVTATATRTELEQAFRARSLTCHPDKVAHLDAEFQALAHHKFTRLLDAYRLLLG
jgi:hypothetical protein